MRFKKILVAVDHSPMAVEVFAQAMELAREEKASLKLFHCLSWQAINQDPSLMIGAHAGYSVALDDRLRQLQQEQQQAKIEQTRAWLQQQCQQAEAEGVPAEFDYDVGAPGPLICTAAVNWGASLIVLGRRGLKGLAEVWQGSVSNYVVHHALCSVLVTQGENSVES